jgi:hypothetical protein
VAPVVGKCQLESYLYVHSSSICLTRLLLHSSDVDSHNDDNEVTILVGIQLNVYFCVCEQPPIQSTMLTFGVYTDAFLLAQMKKQHFHLEQLLADMTPPAQY